ncbi:uncharacterized protein LOC113358975 [Papaver somniferum]|uniref:uncharacterized protein LOC113358975 n=1 Tax=Papaver somniferum TaxID=3469 RepID=UPI000E6F8020|nr:uncharacterized protein LOC113358975 [Papaver somniferum]
MRAKQTPRLPGLSPGLPHIVNLPKKLLIQKELEPPFRGKINHPTATKKSDSSEMQIRGNKGKRLRLQLDEDLKTPTPRGAKHLDFRKAVYPTYDTPNDGGETLFGYKHSWAAKIYATKDHNDAVRLIKRQKASTWYLSLECDEFVDKVKECVLWRDIELAHVKFDTVAVSAFLERHYPETYTMHLPFGKMGITPDDCHNITGLPVEGKCLREGCNPSMSYEALEYFALKCLGWDARKSQCEFRRAVRSPQRGDEYNPREANGPLKKNVKKFKLVKLKEAFGGTKKKVEKGKLVMDRETLRHHVTAFWLYMLGTVIFPEEMSKGSRIKCNQIGGYLTLVQVWIYDHFRKLGLPRAKDPYPYDQPTIRKWLFLDAQKKSKEEQLTSLREKLDKLTVNDVVFHPYAVPDDVSVGEDDLNAFSGVTPYYGPIWYPNGYTIYNPRRILRQLCCVQMDPDVEKENFTLMVQGTKNTEKYFEPNHEPTPAVAHWNALTNYL